MTEEEIKARQSETASLGAFISDECVRQAQEVYAREFELLALMDAD